MIPSIKICRRALNLAYWQWNSIQVIEAVFRKKIAATSIYSENIKIEEKKILFLFCLSSVSPSGKHLVIIWLETPFFFLNQKWDKGSSVETAHSNLYHLFTSPPRCHRTSHLMHWPVKYPRGKHSLMLQWLNLDFWKFVHKLSVSVPTSLDFNHFLQIIIIRACWTSDL